MPPRAPGHSRRRQPLSGIRLLVAGLGVVVVLIVVGLTLVGHLLKSVDVPGFATPASPGDVRLVPPSRTATHPARDHRLPRELAVAQQRAAAAPVVRQLGASGPTPAVVRHHRAPSHRRVGHRPAPRRPSPRPVVTPTPAPVVTPAPLPGPLPVAASPVPAAPIAPAPRPVPDPVAPSPSTPSAPAFALAVQRMQVQHGSEGEPGSSRLAMTLALTGPSLSEPLTFTLRVNVAGVPDGVSAVTHRVAVVGTPADGLALRLVTQTGSAPDAPPTDPTVASNELQITAPISGEDPAPPGAPAPPPAGQAELRLPLSPDDTGDGGNGRTSTPLPVPGPTSGEPATVAARLGTGQ